MKTASLFVLFMAIGMADENPYADVECYEIDSELLFDGWTPAGEVERGRLDEMDIRWETTLRCRAFGSWGVSRFDAKQLWVREKEQPDDCLWQPDKVTAC